MFRHLSLCSAVALAAALGLPAPAEALTMKECSAKYQTAKQDGSLKGMKWNDFRKAECADEDASEADAAAAEKEEAKPASTSTKASTEKASTEKASTEKASTEKASTEKAQPTAAPKTTVSGKVSFPGEVSSKYASETPGKARMHTCLDQYRANKEKGAEQPKWIEKGGGYYSQCNAKLKDSGA